MEIVIFVCIQVLVVLGALWYVKSRKPEVVKTKVRELDWKETSHELPEKGSSQIYICWLEDNQVGLGLYVKFQDQENYEWVVNNEIHKDVVAWTEFNYYTGKEDIQ